MIVEFAIEAITKTNSILEIKQTRIPDDHIANTYFEGCKNGWNHVLSNIKSYCEKT